MPLLNKIKKNRKQIYQFDFNKNLIQKFESIEKAADALNIKRTGITMCLSGKRKTAGGFLFSEMPLLLEINPLTIKETDVSCEICKLIFNSIRSLSSHIQIVHKIETKEYTIKYLLNNNLPKCFVCNNEPRYVSFSFKKYCKEHANIASSEGGKEGGKIKQSWNKGKTKETDSRIVELAKKILGENNPFFGKQHTEETKELLSLARKISKDDFENRINFVESNRNGKVLTNFDYYINPTSFNQECIEVQCNDCKNKDFYTVYKLNKYLCSICNPALSMEQLEVEEFIKGILNKNDILERNNREFIKPKELDIFIPNKKFAIEYNGLYWHSNDKKNKDDHRKKMLLCKEKEISLFQIFSDEWINNRKLIESMITSRLGLSKINIDARKCNIDLNIDKKEAEFFLKKCHISGYAFAPFAIGLRERETNNLVCIMTLRFPIQKKKYPNTMEIARFASELNTNVRGGFQRLLKHARNFIKEKNCNQILSYCDLRFGYGKVYEKSGFIHLKDSEQNYWYSDGSVRYDRTKFKAKNGKPEAEIALEAGVERVYGCGNAVYILKLE